MKITLRSGETIFTYESKPISRKRFNALCKLAGVGIGGGVLLGLVYMLGVWGLVGPIGVLVLVGLYKTFNE